MATETFGGTRPTVVRPQHETSHLSIAFTNDNSADLVEGQDVIMNGNMTVAKQTLATQVPVGTVEKGGADGDLITIGTNFRTTVKGVATGGALAAGALVRQNGSTTSGKPQYVVCAAATYATGMVINGAAQNAEILVGVFRSPVLLPA